MRRVRASFGVSTLVVAIGFGENDVQRNRRRAHVPQAAISRPTTSRRHGHWPIVDRLRSSTSTMTTWSPGGCVASRSQQDVVHRVVEAGKKRGSIDGEHSGDQHGNDAAQKYQTARGVPALMRSHHARGYLTVISTRRLRGSGVSSGV